MAAQSRHHLFLFTLPQALSRPFLQIMAANESRQTPIWIKQVALLCHRPDGLAVPEERWCRFVSNWVITFVVVAGSPAPILGWLTLQAIRIVGKGDGQRCPIRSKWLVTSPLSWLIAAVNT